MGRISATRSAPIRRGLFAMPDYDGSGWNPTVMRPVNQIECWYAAWNAMGNRNSGTDTECTFARDMIWGADLSATLNTDAMLLVNTEQGVLNGRPHWRSVRTGSGTRLRGAESASAPTGGDRTGFAVFRAVDSSDNYIASKGDSDALEEWLLAGLSGNNSYWDTGDATNSYALGTSGAGWAGGHNVVMSGRSLASGNAHRVRANGVTQNSRTGTGRNDTGAGDICIGQGRNGSGLSNSQIAEVIVYRSGLSDDEMTLVERKLGIYYGCAVA